MVVNDCKKFSYSCSRDVYFHAPSHPGTQISAVLTSLMMMVVVMMVMVMMVMVMMVMVMMVMMVTLESQPLHLINACCLSTVCLPIIMISMILMTFVACMLVEIFMKRPPPSFTSSKLIVPIDIPDLPSLLGTSIKRQG